MVSTIPVVEAFGPTIQGEGPSAGRNASFLRLGGCNLSCSWCDTPYSWDGQRYDLRHEIDMLEPDVIVEMLPPAQICVLTGGEPLLHQNSTAWEPMIDGLVEKFSEVHLETNGTIKPTQFTATELTHITVSPKLPNAGAHRGKQDPTIWDGWTSVPQAIFKFVCEDTLDVAKAVFIARGNRMPRERIWVMPQGISAEELFERWPVIAKAAADYGINATHRLHVLAWNTERGH